ncbi:hypothetical protein [Alkalihalobacterium chitinilyticum]|uniref:Uncharacterized protein n=1 Tax=Alkalihalobacterium chitinilyticum TaxID=2980103 RepID=A0ABT5V8P9_9BACI|nr:hypothetical protein [Alkalihalobacterium chitinilyticum]MDE5411844.1 hypothetical protein [Alkalihalobacterium chitinilyticum]
MDPGMMIVLLGFGFFLLTGMFGALGFFFIMKAKKRLAAIFFAIGFSCIAIFIFSLFTFL